MSQEKILVVDDEEDMCELCRRALTKEGYNVDIADSGFKALEKIKENLFDILIVDIRMPGMDGISLLEKVKEIRGESDVIIATGYPAQETAIQALKYDAFDYLIKPFSLEELLLTVRRCIKKQKLSAENIHLKKIAELYEELKVAHEKLKIAQESLIQSEKLSSIGTLSAGIAHEINNPLGTLLGYIQVLQKKVEDKNDKKYLKIMEEEVNKMTKIIQGLLNFAKEQEIKYEPLDINEIIMDTLSFVSTHLQNIKITEELQKNLPKILIDKGQMQQVFVNLFLNAAQAMKDGGTLRISSKLNQEKNIIEIEVEDNGQGIPKNIQDKIFDPFFTTKEVGQGKGLGLSLVYGIIKKHQGDISLKSPVKDDKGTIFTIILPLTKEVKDA